MTGFWKRICISTTVAERLQSCHYLAGKQDSIQGDFWLPDFYITPNNAITFRWPTLYKLSGIIDHDQNTINISLADQKNDIICQMDLFREAERDYCIQIETYSNTVKQSNLMHSILFSIGPRKLHFRYGVSPYQYIEASVYLLEENHRIDYKAEYLNTFARGWVYYLTPYMIHITGEAPDYEIEFSYGDVWFVHGKGMVHIGHELEDISAHVVANAYDYQFSKTNTVRIDYTPGKLSVVSDDQGEYLLERVSETAEALQYRLYQNNTVIGELQLSMTASEEGQQFSARLTNKDATLLNLVITSMGKSSVLPIDRNNATIIDTSSINYLLYLLPFSKP